MIRLFIEGQELDVNEGFTHQITYAVDDINNIDSKSTAFSKTIILPGTANNNKLLGNIFEFGNANLTQDGVPNVGYNFNASKSAKILVEINGLIILKGVLRLMEIVIDGENIEYEIALFGELGGFVSKLGNKKLENLDFKEYDHVYNATNIINSWNQNKTYSSVYALFDSTEKKIRILEILKILDGDIITIANTGSNNGDYTVISTNIFYSVFFQGFVTDIFVQENVTTAIDSTTDITIPQKGIGYFYPLIDYGRVSLDKQNFFYKTLRPALYVREYMDKIITNAGYTYESNFFNTNFFKRLIVPNNDNGFIRKDRTLYIDAEKTSDQTESILRDITSPWSITIKTVPILFQTNTLTNFTYSNGEYTYTGTDEIGVNIILNLLVNYTFTLIQCKAVAKIKIKKGTVDLQSYDLTGDTFEINTTFQTTIKPNEKISANIYLWMSNPFPGTGFNESISITVFDNSTLQVSKNPEGFIEYQLDDTIEINNTLPYNVLQKDFFASILKMFNLMVTEDKYKENHLIIEPWVDFYDLNRTSYLDWTNKLDRSEPIRLKPMSEVNARFYEFKYKSDSDYYNEKYKKKFNEGYGDRKFDNQLEFAKETSSNEVIFSATPLLGYQNRDKIVPTILKWDGTINGSEYVNEEQVGSNIRILQVKKITDVAEWDILDGYPEATGPISGGDNLTVYGYAGHLDDPDAPNVDLNFGATQELYFNLATGALSNNMFNAYYSSYMAEITDKDSRLLTAKFKLTEKDIFNLDFGKFIWIDGVLYRLIKIYDYSEGELCKVDLLRVIYTTY
jgi:hypothetical protein